MQVSTRGRYAIRVMIDLAEHYNGAFVPLKEISSRQEISHKYAENIMNLLSKNHLVDALHGNGGGYKLNRDPSEYTILEILQCTETSLEAVSCLSPDAPPCARAAECRPIGMWKELTKMISDFFAGITLADLKKEQYIDNYII